MKIIKTPLIIVSSLIKFSDLVLELYLSQNLYIPQSFFLKAIRLHLGQLKLSNQKPEVENFSSTVLSSNDYKRKS